MDSAACRRSSPDTTVRTRYRTIPANKTPSAGAIQRCQLLDLASMAALTSVVGEAVNSPRKNGSRSVLRLLWAPPRKLGTREEQFPMLRSLAQMGRRPVLLSVAGGFSSRRRGLHTLVATAD